MFNEHVRRALIRREAVGVSFGFYSADEVRRMSVMEVTNPQIFDPLLRPLRSGLYDPRLGPFDKNDTLFRCGTCGMGRMDCPGHSGHIELPVPVYNPLLFPELYRLLRAQCFNCHHFRCDRRKVLELNARLKLLSAGKIVEARDLIIPPSSIPEELDIEGLTDHVMDNDELAEYLDTQVNTAIGDAKVGWHDSSVHIAQYRKELIRDFLTTCVNVNKCSHCKRPQYKMRKEGTVKVYMLPLSKRNLKKVKEQDGIDEKEEKKEEERKKKSKKSKKSKSRSADSDEDDSDQEIDEETLKAVDEVNEKESLAHPRFVTVTEVISNIQTLWKLESDAVDHLYGSFRQVQGKLERVCDWNMFFLEVLAVPPSRFRPASAMGDKAFESPQNVHLGNVLRIKQQILDAVRLAQTNEETQQPRSKDADARLVGWWVDLQSAVSAMFDNPTAGHGDASGFRQQLEHKEGLFRKNMMGKRVNFAARSVISPDPFLETHEIGVPLHFATRLSFPEAVTPMNFHEMRQAVINGPFKYPGALCVEDEHGNTIDLRTGKFKDEDARERLSRTLLKKDTSATDSGVFKKVWRHLRSGDMLLVNRQPTLHKPGIMAHKAHVLQTEKTIRMHYANCKTFNADFDGDEMNLHFPQSYLGQAEAANIADADQQYIVPTSGEPLRGLIQDHICTGTLITKRDVFFTRAEFQQLLYSSCQFVIGRDHIVTPHPAILKPTPLWTGKQMISALLHTLTHEYAPLSMTSSSKINGNVWGKGCEEGQVIVRQGELLCGVLDKNHVGASASGLVHSAFEVYGAKVAGRILSALGRLFTLYLQTCGFSCGIHDLLLTAKAEIVRKKLMDKAAAVGATVAKEFVSLPVDASLSTLRTSLQKAYASADTGPRLDNNMKRAVNPIASEIMKESLPGGLAKPFPENNFSLMTLSGAKGSVVNHSQISCLLGQQDLEGRRVPLMISGKSLPCFLPYDPSARAGGFITDRFLTGINPQEYFFHCMAGREGLVDTAVKTSRSGYLQRCLMKHLEGLRVHYDYTVRDSDGSIIQFYYGEDSLDPMKTAFLEKFPFLAANYGALLSRMNPAQAAKTLNVDAAEKLARRIAKHPTRDPVLASLSPARNMGAISERVSAKLDDYIARNPDKLIADPSGVPFPGVSASKRPLTAQKFKSLIQLKYMRSLVDPGEAVGVIAAQSVGEPSTQMTLNTFHLAGVGTVNVTLGIPRLREIIMTASKKIATPAMKLIMQPSVTKQQAETLARQLSRLSLFQFVKNIDVTEQWVSYHGQREHQYVIRVELVSADVCNAHGISAKKLRDTLQTTFLKALAKGVEKSLGRRRSGIEEADVEAPTETDADDVVENDEDNEAGTLESGRKSKKKEAVSYDDPEEAAEAQREIDAADAEMEDAGSDEDSDAEPAEVKPSKKAAIPKAPEKKYTSEYLGHTSFDDQTYIFDAVIKTPADSQKLLMVGLVEKTANDVLVRNMPFKRCMVDEKPELHIATEGVDFNHAWARPELIDTRKIDCNDIYAILTTYGVEAARAAIVNQVAAVFGVYGINVDKRHLSLIADYMTYEGAYRPFNRMGIDNQGSSLQKMSFETSTKFLISSALNADRDPLKSPSARIVMGAPIGVGTGSFELRYPLTTAAQ